MDRRSFLGMTLGAPVAYGVAEAFGDPTGSDPRPEYLKRAFEDMAKTRRAGLIVVVPANKERRRLLGESIYDLVHGRPYYNWRNPPPENDWDAFSKRWQRQRRDLHATAVVVCLAKPAATKLFGAGPNRILLDAKGRTIATRTADEKALEPGFVGSLLALSKGKGLANLERIVKTVRASVDAEARSRIEKSFAVVDSGASTPRQLSRARSFLREQARGLGPWLLHAKETAVTDRGRRLLREVMDLELGAPSKRALPYGSRMVEFSSCGCGTFREKEPGEPKSNLPAVACGMAMPQPGSRRFMRFAK